MEGSLPSGHLHLEEENVRYIPSKEEIREYARDIGIDPDREPQLMWLAWEGIKAPLPTGWKLCQDRTGRRCFLNFATLGTTHEHPSKERYRFLVEQERQRVREWEVVRKQDWVQEWMQDLKEGQMQRKVRRQQKDRDSGLGSSPAELSQMGSGSPPMSEFAQDKFIGEEVCQALKAHPTSKEQLQIGHETKTEDKAQWEKALRDSLHSLREDLRKQEEEQEQEVQRLQKEKHERARTTRIARMVAVAPH